MLRIHDPIIFRIASRLLQIEQIDELEAIHEAYKQQPKVDCSKPSFEKWLRLQNRRENIYYTPLFDDKHHILIDDMTAESVAKLRKDGFISAVILESSPKNYQCILTIPKVQSAFSREASNRLTEQLNREYGDKKLSGCIHPHRALGFGNMKPKHQNADGSYPRVKLLYAEKQECDYGSRAYLTARAIAKKYEE